MNKIISILTFLSVCGLVGSFNYWLLEKSVTEEHSNIALAYDISEKIRPKMVHNLAAFSSENLAMNQEPGGKEDYSQHMCKISNPEEVGDTFSVIVFLEAMGRESSYQSRTELASQYSIEDYSGKAEQNLAMLARLKQESNCYGEQDSVEAVWN